MDDRRSGGDSFSDYWWELWPSHSGSAVHPSDRGGDPGKTQTTRIDPGEKSPEDFSELKEDAEELVEKVKEILKETSQRVKDAACRKWKSWKTQAPRK
jgi:hypothetical protein